jgi:hypothetical protein
MHRYMHNTYRVAKTFPIKKHVRLTSSSSSSSGRRPRAFRSMLETGEPAPGGHRVGKYRTGQEDRLPVNTGQGRKTGYQLIQDRTGRKATGEYGTYLRYFFELYNIFSLVTNTFKIAY